MKKIKYLVSLLFLCMMLAGCAKCIKENDKTVVGIVDNKEYDDGTIKRKASVK